MSQFGYGAGFCFLIGPSRPTSQESGSLREHKPNSTQGEMVCLRNCDANCVASKVPVRFQCQSNPMTMDILTGNVPQKSACLSSRSIQRIGTRKSKKGLSALSVDTPPDQRTGTPKNSLSTLERWPFLVSANRLAEPCDVMRSGGTVNNHVMAS